MTLPKLFSGSGMSSYVSGAQLALDGGMSADNFHEQVSSLKAALSANISMTSQTENCFRSRRRNIGERWAIRALPPAFWPPRCSRATSLRSVLPRSSGCPARWPVGQGRNLDSAIEKATLCSASASTSAQSASPAPSAILICASPTSTGARAIRNAPHGSPASRRGRRCRRSGTRLLELPRRSKLAVRLQIELSK